MINAKQRVINFFQDKINDLFEELNNVIEAEKNFTCCSTCGHHEMDEKRKDPDFIEDGKEFSYIFYHQQQTERLREGEIELYLQHHILDEDLPKVLEIVKRYGSDWNGEKDQTIVIPY